MTAQSRADSAVILRRVRGYLCSVRLARLWRAAGHAAAFREQICRQIMPTAGALGLQCPGNSVNYYRADCAVAVSLWLLLHCMFVEMVYTLQCEYNPALPYRFTMDLPSLFFSLNLMLMLYNAH